MLPRSTLPNRAEAQGLRALLPSGRTGECSVLFIVAHPGDEVVAAGGSFEDLQNVRFLHVTNGPPRDLATAIDQGFYDRTEYADARRREFSAALECAGFKEEQTSQLSFAAGEVSRNLATLTMSIAAVL